MKTALGIPTHPRVTLGCTIRYHVTNVCTECIFRGAIKITSPPPRRCCRRYRLRCLQLAQRRLITNPHTSLDYVRSLLTCHGDNGRRSGWRHDKRNMRVQPFCLSHKILVHSENTELFKEIVTQQCST